MVFPSWFFNEKSGALSFSFNIGSPCFIVCLYGGYHNSMNLAGQFLKHFGIQKKAPDFRFLSEIMTALANIPYENATKILACRHVGMYGDKDRGLPLRMPDEVFGDYLCYGLGGTCF